MASEDRVYQSFGELLYVIAMSDGVIQKEELEKLDEILKGHPKAKEIQWSFLYEQDKNNDIELLYRKVIEVFADHGPNEEYEFMIFALEKLAEASDGVSADEQKRITSFSKDLLVRFQNDIDNIQQKLQ
ncbi:TerB family tellurite resistance protein [Aquimarina brevivitae]|uniref:Tellurite resistance protein TerB n=1 Tax=Aquimarina brevivitae TaxID=323412 RepID=A0A4Q7PG65_9FLAO|nr:TerB family tellurite resistance protein [Aquimarina brevivitae]RZS99137.1 hypothetical protein EV197_0344 [Aquimarina brevivitae]